MPFPTTTTPATGDGLVFAAGDGAITALEQRSGTPLWKTPIDSPLAAGLYWDTGWLLASTESGDLLALHAQDGRILWRQALGSPLARRRRRLPAIVSTSLSATAGSPRLRIDSGIAAWASPLNEPVTGMLALEDQLLVGTPQERHPQPVAVAPAASGGRSGPAPTPPARRWPTTS